MLRLYWRVVFRPYIGRITVIAVISLLSSIAEVAGIGLIIPLAEVLIHPGDSATSRAIAGLRYVVAWVGLAPRPEWLILAGLAAITGLIVLKSSLKLLEGRWVGWLMNEVSNTYRRRMVDAYLRVQYAEVMRRGRGAIYQDIEGVADGIRSAIVQGAQLLYAVAYALAAMALLLYISWWATLLIGVLVFFVARRIRNVLEARVRELGSQLHSLDQRVAGFLVDTLDGVRVVKAAAVEAAVVRRLEAAQHPRLQLGVRYRIFSVMPPALFEVSGVLLIALLMALAFSFPGLGLTLPSLMAMIIALNRLLAMVGNINTHLVLLDGVRRRIEVADEVLSALPREQSGNRPLPSEGVGVIHMERVSFHYPERMDVRVLHDVDIRFRRGQVTALVGQTGAGKTTVADLLVRLYEPFAGHILADGIELKEINLAAWRRSIGYVGQDPFLFNGTLRDNITLWEEEVDPEEFERACRAAQVHDFVEALPDGYDTLVGDRGLKLSGGQRQRVAIARAILRKPGILIFDEATSALDNLTEKAVHEAIGQIRAASIVILIAHRLSTVQDADQIVVFHEGHMVEQGRYEDLLERRGYFWRLYQGEDEADLTSCLPNRFLIT